MIKSPCIKQCNLLNNICVGCKRTINEITQWMQYTDKQRERIIKELKRR